jgi:DNA invertase Pin-like site-specific DNA recombinase
MRQYYDVVLEANETQSGGAGAMAMYGYARVSTTDQDLTIQREALEKAGCSIVRAEKVTGTRLEGRDELRTLLDFMRRGDVLVVTRIDRLARSLADLALLVREMEAKGIALKATEQPIDTSTPAGRAFLQMLGIFAEFETAIRKDRQLEGIAKAKEAGVYQGRKATIDPGAVRRLAAEGLGPSEIAKRLGIGRASVYRAIATVET